MGLASDNGIRGLFSAYKHLGLWQIEIEIPTWVADDMLEELRATGDIKITREPEHRFEGGTSLIVVRQSLPLLED